MSKRSQYDSNVHACVQRSTQVSSSRNSIRLLKSGTVIKPFLHDQWSSPRHIRSTRKSVDPGMRVSKTYSESNLRKLLRIKQQTTVKDKCGFGHAIVDMLPVNVQELFPFSGNHNSLFLLASLCSGMDDVHIFLDYGDNAGISLTPRDRLR